MSRLKDITGSLSVTFPQYLKRCRRAWVAAGLVLLLHPPAASSKTELPSTGVETSKADGKEVSRGRRRKILGGGAVAASYIAMETYAFFAWYKTQERTSFFTRDEGWFERDSYAGGADKLGHFFASYAMVRTTRDLLDYAGMRPLPATVTANLLDFAFLTSVEVKDGYTDNLGFSWGDSAFNVLGNIVATAFIYSPRLDEMFDFRLEYYPSQQYIDIVKEESNLNVIEDYTGMRFGLWYHLASFSSVKKYSSLSWLRFIDVGIGYQAKGYRPRIAAAGKKKRLLSFGVSLYFTPLLDSLFDKPRGGVRKTAAWALEYFTVPKTAPHLEHELSSE